MSRKKKQQKIKGYKKWLKARKRAKRAPKPTTVTKSGRSVKRITAVGREIVPPKTTKQRNDDALQRTISAMERQGKFIDPARVKQFQKFWSHAMTNWGVEEKKRSRETEVDDVEED